MLGIKLVWLLNSYSGINLCKCDGLWPVTQSEHINLSLQSSIKHIYVKIV